MNGYFLVNSYKHGGSAQLCFDVKSDNFNVGGIIELHTDVVRQLHNY
jgi:hypothetical protein